jgi:hypothetical protein
MATDLFSFGKSKNLLEQVTPHKMALLVLIREYCIVRGKMKGRHFPVGHEPEIDIKLAEKEMRDFMTTMLKLLQVCKEHCKIPFQPPQSILIPSGFWLNITIYGGNPLWPLLNSLKTHVRLTRSPLLSTVADTGVTRCDSYPHLNVFHAV